MKVRKSWYRQIIYLILHQDWKQDVNIFCIWSIVQTRCRTFGILFIIKGRRMHIVSILWWKIQKHIKILCQKCISLRLKLILSTRINFKYKAAFVAFQRRYNLLIFRSGRGETARFYITTFVQSYRLQTRGQSQQEVRLQGRTRKHEDLPLRGWQSREHEPVGECSDSGDAFTRS